MVFKSIFVIVLAFLIFAFKQYLNKDATDVLYDAQQQIEIITQENLLNSSGYLAREGWARHPFFIYSRDKIQGIKLGVKEWDYYMTISHTQNFAVCVTISDLTYGGLMAIAYIDLENGTFYQVDTIKLFTLGKLGLSPTSTTDMNVSYTDDTVSIKYEKKGELRHIFAKSSKMKLPNNETGFEADIVAIQPSNVESMNIATSWSTDRTCFYLNEKVNCMVSTGKVKLGKREIDLDPDNSFTVLDWGRGKWTYKNTWYWSSASGKIDGIKFGFNLGYGFTDRSPATENVLFYGDKVHKLNEVVFEIPTNEKGEYEYDKQIKVESDDKRLNLVFTPIVDRSSNFNLLIIASNQHQVFGRFSGKAVLDDGKEIDVNDFLGFIEVVKNRY
ncbi:DUF2804 domain-containing protein [Histomonas meleagridis]|uniref:DUF2804 domain-containing protein n=1 Tax=Histomonas meleagridis TaxID=135588 RepID=UPI00355A061E|nr:DUF2804 domain-containing protein [Histomonas meleagridis]KAH0803311.1 DUF2804 domain-containing protein [Histomonas meleagridis]